MINRWRAAARAGLLPALGLSLLGFALVGAAAAYGSGEPEPFSHAPIRLVAGTLLAVSADGDEELSDPVAYCLACHGEEGTRSDGAELPHPTGSAGPDHPVDVRYPESDPGYRPASELAPDLLLQDRRVTCLSCHAYDDPGHAPVLATGRSELCRACHLT